MPALPRSRTIVIVAFPGAQVLDVTGPASVFTSANRSAGRGLYRVLIASTSGGSVPLGDSVTLSTRRLGSIPRRSVDTLLVSGGARDAIRRALRDRLLERWVTGAAKHARRVGSVCSGAFVLAGFGLLDGRRAATHWAACERLSHLFPKVSVDADSLYVVDGRFWTSAGVTTGIDMALAMVEADAGGAVAGAVARELVVYSRRPGNQSQFSAVLRAQVDSAAPYAALVDWIVEHLDGDCKVETLARRAGQSPRDFHRKFSLAVGRTPARFVEDLRLDRVRLLLSHDLPLKEIAAKAGFGGLVTMSRAFTRRFGVNPSLFRQMQAGNGSPQRERASPR
jgi:transcriptional regulator GlxA family with amidase domain